MGLPGDAVEAYLQNETRDDCIEVLECNWTTYLVFSRCEPTLHVGLGGALYTGVSSAEVTAVMDCMRVPESSRLDVFDGVKHMARIWAETRNAIAAAK